MYSFNRLVNPLTLICTVSIAVYSIYLAYLLATVPLPSLILHHEIPPLAPPHNDTQLGTPPSPRPNDSTVKEFCKKSRTSPLCYTTLSSIPSAMYATDTAQLTVIVTDYTYNTTAAIRLKVLNHISSMRYELSRPQKLHLENCVDMCDNILNYCRDHSCGISVHDYFVKVELNVLDCVIEFEHDVMFGPDREKGDRALEEFTHNTFGGIQSFLEVVADSAVGQGAVYLKLDELNPKPFVVLRGETSNNMDILIDGGHVPVVVPNKAHRFSCFFLWLTSVFSFAN